MLVDRNKNNPLTKRFCFLYTYSGNESTNNILTSTTTTTTDATSISKKNVSEKNTSDDTTTSQPTTSTECKDSTPTGPTVQQLLDLVQELKNVSKMSTSTDSPSTTKTCKEEQKPPAVCTPETIAGTTTVTKAVFVTSDCYLL